MTQYQRYALLTEDDSKSSKAFRVTQNVLKPQLNMYWRTI